MTSRRAPSTRRTASEWPCDRPGPQNVIWSAPGSTAAIPARPGVDDITAAMALSSVQLSRIVAVEVTSAGNVVRLGR